MASNGAAASQLPVVAGPPLSLVVREKHRSYIAPFPYAVGSEGSPPLPEMREDAVFSPSGHSFIGVEGTDRRAVIRSSLTGAEIVAFGGADSATLPLAFNFVTFSPLGSYVLAWARPVTGSSQPNLVVADADTGAVVTSFFQKNFHKDHWPSVQWSADESVAARSVSNTVHFFSGKDMSSGPTSKLHIPGVSSFALSGGSAPYHIAAFAAGKSGAPGRIALYELPDAGGAELMTRSTFRADAVEFKWASTGAACLALSTTDSDSSGKSYYGESEAYYLHVASRTHKRLELPQEGPTYDVAWSPGGREFIVIYGFMPARATMFDEACEPVFDFGTGARNTISFSPHGKFFALAGFGSLAGLVQFWDKNKMEMVGTVNLNATTDYSWSPCSRYFLAATTFPRLRVDNIIRVVRFDGQLIHEHRMEDTLLLQARFRPALKSAYLEPRQTMGSMIGGPPVYAGAKPGPGANGVGGGDGASKPTGAYRPPGARGTTAAFSLHRDVEAGKVDKASFLAKKSGGAGDTGAVRRSGVKKSIPGMEVVEEKEAGVLSKAAIKRKKKKEKEAEKERLAASGAAPPAAPAAGAEQDAPKGIEELDTVEALAKRIKGLKKKLRSVETLKTKLIEGGESDMNVDQIEKIKSEPLLEKQVEAAEKKLETLAQG